MSDKHHSLARKLMVGATGIVLTFSTVAAVSADTTEQEQNQAPVNNETQVDNTPEDNQPADNTAGENEGTEGNNEAEENEGTEGNNEAEENEGTEGNDTAGENEGTEGNNEAEENEGTEGNNEAEENEGTEGNDTAGENEGTEGNNEAGENEGTEGNNEAEENEETEDNNSADETITYTDLQEKPNNVKLDYFEEILEAVAALSGKDIINGYEEDNTFRAFNTITRDEVAKIIAKTLELEVTEGTASSFTDVAGSWAEKQGYLAAVEEAKLMQGNNGKFRANDEITRAELAIVIVRAFELENKTDFESTFADIDDLYNEAIDAITILEANELTQGLGDNKYGPKSNLKRGDTAIFLHRILVDLQEEKAESEAAIQSVEEKITALDPTSDSFADDVESARTAFDALTEEQQAAVTNSEALETAESTVELIEAVTMTEEDGKVILSTTKSVEGLNTEISLSDSEGNAVTFGSLFSSLVLTTTVGENEPGVYDLYELVKDSSTLPYGDSAGYTLTAGENQVTELAAELNEEAAAGTYTLKTVVKKDDVILETFSKSIEVKEETTDGDTAGEETTDGDATDGDTAGEEATGGDATDGDAAGEESPEVEPSTEDGTEENTTTQE